MALQAHLHGLDCTDDPQVQRRDRSVVVAMLIARRSARPTIEVSCLVVGGSNHRFTVTEIRRHLALDICGCGERNDDDQQQSHASSTETAAAAADEQRQGRKRHDQQHNADQETNPGPGQELAAGTSMGLEPPRPQLLTCLKHRPRGYDIVRPHFNGESRFELTRTALNVAGAEKHHVSVRRLCVVNSSNGNPVHTSIVPIVGEVGPSPRYSPQP